MVCLGHGGGCIVVRRSVWSRFMMIFSRFSCRFGLVRGLRVFVCLVGSDHVGFGEYRGCCFVFGRHGGVRIGVCCF